MPDPRNTYRWKQLRARLRATATHCPLCNQPLDHTHPRSSRYPSVDHITPIAHGGAPFDPTNLRVICTGCNSSKSAQLRNGTNPPPNRWASRTW